MAEQRRQCEQQSLLGRERNGSWSSEESYSLAADVEMIDLEEASFRAQQNTPRPRWWTRPRANSKVFKTPAVPSEHAHTWRKRSRYHRLWRLALHLPYILIALLVVTGVFFPSYTTPPPQYGQLRTRVLEATREGSANLYNEKIFIAASLYDKNGDLLRGDWGQSVLHLVSILGHNNVFVSIYENDPSEDAMLAMSDFRERLPCSSAIVREKLDTSDLDHVLTADGTQRLKRMSFLADVRNRALRPLDDEKSDAYNVKWDKLLYLNDVVFDPIDAANLLMSTNVDSRTGRTDYRAACSTDFINPFKFYDTFATRDLEGYDMGVPFYPWFTNAGQGQSRADVLAQKDAVRVKSCWGGMVAFEAKWFQHERQQADEEVSISKHVKTKAVKSKSQGDDHATISAHDVLIRGPADVPSSPLRFRSEADTFWDASECCLIHADLAYAANSYQNSSDDTGIYMNPYIRVAYSRSTLAWLPLTRRFERLYSHAHTLINWIGARPGYNARQFEQPGEEVTHQVWRWDDEQNNTTALTGSYVEEKVVATPGMFCGTRKMLYIKSAEEKRRGGKNWGSEPVPAVPASTH